MKIKASLSCLSAIACLVLFVSACGRKEAELAAQRGRELETIRAELERFKTEASTLQSEVARLKKDNEELLRLRNKVRQLLADNQELTKQAQTAQAQAAQAVQAGAQQAQQLQQLQANQLAAQQAQQADPASACVNQLRQIDEAKQRWALENRKTADATPTAQDLAHYFKDGAFPVCPAGGAYTLNAIATKPLCTVPGHALPQ